MTEDLYEIYSNFIDKIIKEGNISNFKSHPEYTYMLEHVKKDKGQEYLQCIQTKTNIPTELIIKFCQENDNQGNPHKENFEIVSASPTSLRYIWFAHLILTHFKKFNKESYDIVEIGGGYGGLCFAISFFSKFYDLNIKSYTIIDLENPLKLQELYLKNLQMTFPVKFENANTFGSNISNQDLFLVSTYCFSEINFDYQKEYINNLFPKVSHGFIAWNIIPTYYFGFNFNEEDEIPKTGNLNRFIYF